MIAELHEPVFQSVFREAYDAFFVLDPETFQILEVNPAAQRLTGLRRKELQQRTMGELLVGDRPDGLADVLTPCRSTSSARTTDSCWLRTADGGRLPVQISVSRIHTDDGPLGLMIVRDVSAQRKAEEERRRLAEQLLEARRVESLALMATGLAHDFNNLLAGVLGNVSLARMELADDSPTAPLLQQAEEAALRGAGLTQQLLILAGRRLAQARPVDLTQVIGGMRGELGQVVTPPRELLLELTGDLPPVLGDAQLLRRAVHNLAVHAAETLAGGGTVTVRTRRAASETPAGDWLALDVADDGPGMDEAAATRVFEPFFTFQFTERGLALAAVKGIARSHGGDVRVASAPGRGTTFTLLLPVSGS